MHEPHGRGSFLSPRGMLIVAVVVAVIWGLAVLLD